MNNHTALTGYQFLHQSLSAWGITHYCGVTGGGVIHFLRDIPPLTDIHRDRAGFLTLNEYSAGFAPLGYFLASGKVSAAVATTGAATRLLSCGLSDAKLHDIPAVYIVPLSGREACGYAPLQDTSEHGSNIAAQLRCELPDSVFVLDTPETLAAALSSAHEQLKKSGPVVLLLLHSALNSPLPCLPAGPQIGPPCGDDALSREVLDEFRASTAGRRLVLLVGEEMARYPDAARLTTRFSRTLRCATLWSINGASAVHRDNLYGYGHISFGGTDEALSLYQSLGEDDVLLILGACPDEYTVNLQKIPAGKTFYLTNIPGGYGSIHNSFAHMAEGTCCHVSGPLDTLLDMFLEEADRQPFGNIPAAPAPEHLCHRRYPSPRSGFVDMAELYRRLDRWWPQGAVGFDDVCLAYKDRQYVTERPSAHIRFFSLYRGSAMGGAFGAAVGAKLASPDTPVFLFTGDGCFRLFAGGLGEVSTTGIVIFLLNNADFSIVSQGLSGILPRNGETYHHARLSRLDYCGMARACGWEAEKLAPDLSNLEDVLNRIGGNPGRSFLVDIPVDRLQVLGSNPRASNL